MIEPAPNQSSGSRIVSRILPPAIRFWLRTQVDDVKDLTFRIEGRDRDILVGHIPEVWLSAQKAIYQGLHLSHIAVKATDIRINLGQVVRRKPLRLLAAFPVSGDVRVTLDDLNASLQSPLLGEGIYQFLKLIAKSQPESTDLTPLLARFPEGTILPQYRPTADIEADTITLRLMPSDPQSGPEIAIATSLTIRDGNRLCLENPRWLSSEQTDAAITMAALHGFEINLGSAVTLTECEVQDNHLALAGTIRVFPPVST
ncbi:MAG: DUF2993 domain-containing protein [Cyanobacteria bacterium P01_H01_bin.58]